MEARLARMRALLPQAKALRIECAAIREQVAQEAREAKRRKEDARTVTLSAGIEEDIEKSKVVVAKLAPKFETVALAAKPPVVDRTIRKPPAWLKLEKVQRQ
jgi:hypothetical protein